MIYIPLNYFVDRSNLLLPRGTVNSRGLTSAMRNPMLQNFSESRIICDLRPRDLGILAPPKLNEGLSNSHRIFESKRRASLMMDSYNTRLFEFACDDDGIYINANGNNPSNINYSTYICYFTDYAEKVYNLNPRGQPLKPVRFAMLAAIKLTSLKGTNVLLHDFAGSNNYYFHYPGFGGGLMFRCNQHDVNKYYYRAWMRNSFSSSNGYQGFLDNQSASTKAAFGDLSPTNDLINESTINSWLLFQLVKAKSSQSGNDNDFTMRVLGGQFTNNNNPSQKTIIGNPNYPFDYNQYTNIYIPMAENMKVGFVTLAMYTDNLPDNKTGAELDCIDWTIFDNEHTCGQYQINGYSLNFECEGQVAWEFRKNGVWTRTDFFNTGQHHIKRNFDAIRPVLKNTGFMNAENNAVIKWVGVNSVANNYSINLIDNKQMIYRITVDGFDDAVQTEWEFTGSENFTIVTGSQNPTILDRVKASSINSLDIALSPNSTYNLRVRQKLSF